MSNYTPQQLEAAKAAKSPEELVAMAKSEGVELTHEQAEGFINQRQGELADEELDNVAGGGCYNDGWLVVTVGTIKSCFECKQCGGSNTFPGSFETPFHQCKGKHNSVNACCNTCKWISYERALWLCKNPANRE